MLWAAIERMRRKPAPPTGTFDVELFGQRLDLLDQIGTAGNGLAKLLVD